MNKIELHKYMFYESIDRATGKYIKPRYMYYVRYYKSSLDAAEIEDVCIDAISYLTKKYRDVNKSLVGLTVHNKIKNRIRNNNRKRNKEVLTLDINDKDNRPLYSRLQTPDKTEEIKVIWKEPLTQRELLYSRLISKGVLSNVIAKDYKIPTKEQKALKESLKGKIVIGDNYEN